MNLKRALSLWDFAQWLKRIGEMEYHYCTVWHKCWAKEGWAFGYEVIMAWHGQGAYLYGGWLVGG
jgi:hypothetical protein